MIINLGRIDEQNENFNKEIRNCKISQKVN